LYERNLKIVLAGILPPLFNGDGRGELTRKKKKAYQGNESSAGCK
jgi:hypothetical protein